MDRKAWIVIILCAAGIAVNAWFASKNAAQSEAAKAAEAAKAPPPAAQPAAPGAAPAPATAGAATSTPAAAPLAPEQTHVLTRGNVSYHFTTRGGGVAKVVMVGADHVTLNEVGKEPIGALRREAAGADSVPYTMVESTADTVVFEGTSADGIVIRKAYSLRDTPDDHLLKLAVTLTNSGATPHRSEEYYLYAGVAASLRPDEIKKPRVFWNNAGDSHYKDTGYFGGGWFSSEKAEFRESFPRLKFAGVMTRFHATIIRRADPVMKPGKVWASRVLVDHSQDQFKDLEAAKTDYGMQAAVGLPTVELAPGASQTEQYEIYIGPKEYKRLNKLGEQMEDVMFYGWFSWISIVLTTVMRWMHDWSGNWGVAIILLTIVVRTCIWPIHAKSTYTMKRMGLLAPKMKELQEKFKDDPQRQQMEVMKLYKDYGVNPLGGCLPMLLQIPIFFGFYSVLENAAELRGQPFMGWVHDLSIPDTIYTLNLPFALPFVGHHFDINPLPIIMGVTMILQMKLTPQPQTVDKTQKIMFTIMPFFFLFICYNFAAALSLYWSTQNVFSIFQSWIMKLYMPEPKLEKKERVPKPKMAGPSLFQMPGAQPKEKKGKKPPKLGG
jgi:YidC/Oxa1 family membrane protein insertase